MTERMTKESDFGYYEGVLTTSAAAVKGEMACIDTSTGLLTIGGTSTTLLAIGYFVESKTGDGASTIGVKLFREAKLHWFANDDSPNEVDATDVGNECYIKDGRTVSMSSASSTRSKAGRIWAVSDVDGVLVELGLMVTGPTGSSGAGVANKAATRAAVKAIAAAVRADGQLLMVTSDGSLWRFVSAGTGTGDEAGELMLEPDAGTGRWVRADKACVLKIPVAYGDADGAHIFTVPAGFVLRLSGQPFWEVTTGWTGGTASTIGVAASVSGYNTAGDLLGGAAGEATAVLGTAGVKAGTVGPKLDTLTELQALFLEEDDYLTYEEITSAYTAGAGFVCLPVEIMTPA